MPASATPPVCPQGKIRGEKHPDLPYSALWYLTLTSRRRAKFSAQA
jgi:hypothetical protein